MPASLESQIRQSFQENIETKQRMLGDSTLIQHMALAVSTLIEMFRRDGCLFVAGNGGSASDAEHIVAEFVARLCYDRAPLRAQALTASTASLTCIANDYGYEELFARQIWASGRKGDVFLAISTSGNSKNILLAVERAREAGMTTIGLTGESGGKLGERADIAIKVPATRNIRLQECHILILHTLCEWVEATLFPANQEKGGGRAR